MTAAAVILMIGTGVAGGGHAAWEAIVNRGTPSCSWPPLQVRGDATGTQVGLVRCYLGALASGKTAGLIGVSAGSGQVRITSADLKYAKDARAGLATGDFSQNPEDSASASVNITFADGVSEYLGLTNLIAIGGSQGWRVDIGTPVGPDTGPPPATAAPSSSAAG
jgi:hypothetical protein